VTSESRSSVLLEIRALKTVFHTTRGIVSAVDGIDLTINRKEVVGLVGESGCGKTMTALSVMRLVPNPPGRIVDGEILFEGVNLLKLTQKEIQSVRGRSISMIFQDPMTYLDPVMNIGDQIAEAIICHQDVSKSEAHDRVLQALQMVRMPNPARVSRFFPHQISGGMKQRAMIAMALSCRPSLLIADEPTTALDVTVQMQILDLIKKIKDDLATSLLLITHDFGIVAEICDRVYVMYAGKIVENADAVTLYERPKHPYTYGLLECVSGMQGSQENLPTIPGFVPDLVDFRPGCRFQPRCSRAKPICGQKEPPPVAIEPHHTVFCWLHV